MYIDRVGIRYPSTAGRHYGHIVEGFYFRNPMKLSVCRYHHIYKLCPSYYCSGLIVNCDVKMLCISRNIEPSTDYNIVSVVQCGKPQKLYQLFPRLELSNWTCLSISFQVKQLVHHSSMDKPKAIYFYNRKKEMFQYELSFVFS